MRHPLPLAFVLSAVPAVAAAQTPAATPAYPSPSR